MTVSIHELLLMAQHLTLFILKQEGKNEGYWCVHEQLGSGKVRLKERLSNLEHHTRKVGGF